MGRKKVIKVEAEMVKIDSLKLLKEELLELKLDKAETREKELEMELKKKDYSIKALELKIMDLQNKLQRIEEEKKIQEMKAVLVSIDNEVANLKKHVEDKYKEHIPLMKKIAENHNIGEDVRWGFDPRSGEIKIIDK
jgi:chromosome segregation ATPase